MLKDAKLFRQQCYLDGAWCAADDGRSFPVTDPASGQVGRGPGVPSLEDCVQLISVDGAIETEFTGALTEPDAGGLACAGVVVLPAVGHGVQVVVLGAGAQFADRQHAQRVRCDPELVASGANPEPEAPLTRARSWTLGTTTRRPRWIEGSSPRATSS